MADNFNKNRIAKNTILLYIRMLFTMWLNLYATRLVLQNLGVEDMGVYGVVGSVVSLLAVFSSGITNTIQRFITFELGKERGNVNRVFCSSLNVAIVLSVVILILLESVGVWFLYHHVNIPQASMQAAFWVYQFSVFTCIIVLISIPYNALVIAHEKMDAYAVISILQVILTCGIAYSLSYITSRRLFMYALFMAGVSVVIMLLYQFYCYVKFQESHYHFMIDKEVLKQIGKYAGVTTTSGMMESIYNQGVILVINWCFGVALNAVYTIALQLKNSVLSFAFNIFKAISPQITKTYADGEIETHKKLVYAASKYQVYMIYFILIPFMFRTEYILQLWLGHVPPYMVTFAQTTIIISLLYALFEPIRTAVLATGIITQFMIIPNIFFIATLPVSYVVAKLSGMPFVLILVVVIIDVMACGLRLYYALRVSPLQLKELCLQVVLPSVLVAICGVAVCWILSLYLLNNLKGLLILLIISSVSLCAIIYLVGINKQERQLINGIVTRLFTTKLLTFKV